MYGYLGSAHVTLIAALREIRRRELWPRLKAVAEPLPALMRLAERLEPRLRNRFLRAVQRVQERISLEELAQAITDNALNAAEIAARLSEFPALFGDLATDIVAGFRLGAGLGMRDLAHVDVSGSFDLINPYAVEFSRTATANLVRPFIDNARDLIRREVVRGLSGELTAMGVARNIRDWIGLYPAQVQAVESFRARLEAQGADNLERRVERYAAAQLRYRAEMIARTEVQRAAIAGQREAWSEAERQGFITASDYEREWSVTWDERLCPQCEPLDATRVSFDGEFPDGDPPIHPHCRCIIQLVRKDA